MIFKTFYFVSKKIIRIYHSVQKLLDESDSDSATCFKLSKKKINVFTLLLEYFIAQVDLDQ